ncbi:HNH endonuclease [Methylomonas sp. MO1]|uniref:homing endonuclease associated repeat-containing protein n=1 Tax=Methylomonas sp. MO1 TaxID=3073619 RepID=UPI0028A33075|nr:HNH endonuclease [Methylomonas sp. MO1]MDT4288491.1 HNH endonuclease [Methylomonas sp. MO1]
MKFELEESLRGAPDKELLEDMCRSAMALGKETITMAEYEKIGKAHPSTIQRRFGSWPKALELAELKPSRSKIGISDNELFENIKSLWITLGRQPRYSEVRAPNSLFSVGTYENRFGSWSKALHETVAWVNSEPADQPEQVAEEHRCTMDSILQTPSAKRRTRREISDRQRFRILVRDGFRCKACGSSPLVKPGVELHVDHILPWSKGGETTDDNLETKCAQCNLGKGNAFHA